MGGAALAALYLLTKGRESEVGMAKVDDRVTALITSLGDSIQVIQTIRTPDAQAKAIASGASEWSGDPRKAPHPEGRAVDMQPKNPPLWGDVDAWARWAEDVADKAKNLGLNPRWGGHWYGLLDGDPRALIERYRTWKRKKDEKPFWDPVHFDFPKDGGGVYMQPQGYRRAKQDEVSSSMMSDAINSLTLPIGTFLIRDGYAIGLEHHENASKGRHKGATVFLPSAPDVDSAAA